MPQPEAREKLPSTPPPTWLPVGPAGSSTGHSLSDNTMYAIEIINVIMVR